MPTLCTICRQEAKPKCRTRQAVFGFESSGKATHCGEHKVDGMKNVKATMCETCGKIQASFGFERGKATRCEEHKVDGMKNVKSKMCVECGKHQASFGFERGKPATHCTAHKADGMMDVVSKMCAVCGKHQASFGLKKNRPTHCATHKVDGMTNVRTTLCEVCNERIACFGFENDKPTHCVKHKIDRMVNVMHRMCMVCDDQATRATFGFVQGQPTHCATHKIIGMEDVKHKKCGSCNLFFPNHPKKLCDYCDPNGSKKQLTREHTVVEHLRTSIPDKFKHDRRAADQGCGIYYRPDILYEGATHDVVVEVDEDQHKTYPPECELIRMFNIVSSRGRRCVFIRYNPDKFEIDGRLRKVQQMRRLDVLTREVRRALDSKPSDFIEIAYLFYDGGEIRRSNIPLSKGM